MKHCNSYKRVFGKSGRVVRIVSITLVIMLCLSLFQLNVKAEEEKSETATSATAGNYTNESRPQDSEEEEVYESASVTDAAEQSTFTDAREVEFIPVDYETAPEEDADEENLSAATGSVVKQLPDSLNIAAGTIKVYPNDANNGIYFLNGDGEFYFYSLDDYSLSRVNVNIGSNRFYGNNALYWTSYEYDYNASDDSQRYINHIYKYNMNTKKQSLMCDIRAASNVSNIGVDGKENVFATTFSTPSYFNVYSKSGNLICSTEYTGTVGDFYAFDDTSGNFYYRGYYNWVYWGYDHDMDTVATGNFDGSTVRLNTKPLIILAQGWYRSIAAPVDFYGGRYVAIRSLFCDGLCGVLDSNKFNIDDVTDITTEIVIDGGVRVTAFAVKDPSVIKVADYALSSDFGDEGQYRTDQKCIGSASAYTKKNGKEYIWIATDDKVINRYLIKDGKKSGTLNTKYNVFKMMSIKNELVVIEKNGGKYYIEKVNTDEPTELNISTTASLKTGQKAKLNVTTNSALSDEFTYSSSDNKIAAVSRAGIITAWKPGTATITVKSKSYKLSKQVKIKVTKRSIGSFVDYSRINSKTISVNIHAISNYTYGQVINSYITDLGKGKYMRVQYVGKKKICVEYFDSMGAVSSKKEITAEGELFGGFFAGKNNYFVVSGNSGDAASTNSFVITKYSKSWSKQGVLKLKDVYTTGPFSAGSCRMDELSGKLYIHTCHVRPDGHQSNCTFVVNESSMKLVDSFYDTMNVSYGYVSHSFNQFIKNDGKYIYRVDHGDAYPRGIVVTKIGKDDKVTSVNGSYNIVVPISGNEGANYTGHSVGGFELSDNNCVIAYNAVASDDTSIRNVYVGICDKELGNTKRVRLSNYSASGNVTSRPPVLVNLKNDHFLVMWEEFSTVSYDYVATKTVTIDEDGNITSGIVTIKKPLSDCQPVYTDKGIVAWYVSNDTTVNYCAIDPYNPKGSENDNGDGTINMFRLYNPNSGEHFYTASVDEKNNLISVGWNYEGIGWKAPKKSKTPVYRLYNPNAGDHHYTMSAAEKDNLIAAGWKYEGIGWYSDDAKSVPLYRQYNPNAKTGSHNYTTSKKENDWLVSLGWKAEGIGWYGAK